LVRPSSRAVSRRAGTGRPSASYRRSTLSRNSSPDCRSVGGILAHQLLSERRFFAHFVGLDEPPVEQVLPPGEGPPVQAYLDKYIWLARRPLPQFPLGTTAWWLEERPFFGGLRRQRVWVFWRRVLHTCHHRTQVQAWLRLAGHEPVPAIYGPSGDVTWDAADPTYSAEAARRGPEGQMSPLGRARSNAVPRSLPQRALCRGRVGGGGPPAKPCRSVASLGVSFH
jgi:uncharacterized damage-inducible protein DinB